LTIFAAGCEPAIKSPDSAVKTEIVKTKGGIEMVSIPANTFLMGSIRGAPNESPAHAVSVDAYLIDRHEVTQEEYEKFVIGNPSKFKEPNNPVDRVRWVEAALYCNARSTAEGLEPCYNEETFECHFETNGYRLPTEAEWENACRAGTKGDYSFAGGEAKLANVAWFKGDASDRTHVVGSKQPNAWGLYDMHGNVSEWCQDIYDGTFYENAPSSNPCNPTGGEARVLRGGSYSSNPKHCRSTSRSGESPGSFADACFARPDIGFRCVRRVSQGDSDMESAPADKTHSP
jgi:formylglycine-generating enzyme required for sulfatase activity